MKTSTIAVLYSSFALLLPFSSAVLAQEKTLAATMDVYVFPNSGQDSSQQSMDESECYNWAVTNVGTDPFQIAKQQQSDAEQAQANQQAASQAGAGSGARGAVGGAAAGALIGEIASDDAGKGAAWGAAAGLVRGRRKGRQAQAEASQQAQAQQESKSAVTDTELANFKKAFSVCLEAKEYMVKY